MRRVLANAWPLLVGMFLLQIGNGLQSTVLGIRGGLEGFDATTMGVVMSGYFVGFLFGAQATPAMLRRVGHVRTFAALVSLLSAALIVYAAAVHPVAWTAMRVLAGFCFSGIYVVAESWLNNQSTNATRGKALSIYLVCQTVGIVLAQAIVPFGDPQGYDLFVLMTVAVSLACAPILLTASPAPVHERSRTLSIRDLFRISPLGAVGMMLVGAICAGMFGMSAGWGSQRGLDAATISLVVSAIFVGSAVMQFPIGYVSDRVDRRGLIVIVTFVGAGGALVMTLSGSSVIGIVAGAFVVGGMANPLYSLLIAHTNDFMELDDMAAAAGGLMLLNGVGSAATPFAIGWLMTLAGPAAFPIFLAVAFAMIGVYGLYRATVRPATPADETLPYTAVAPTTSTAGYAAAQAVYADAAVAQAEAIDLEYADAVGAGGLDGWGDDARARAGAEA
ncbi:MAG: MFS transporter [Paracoccaceae bacterium]